ncbi:MULTISPECIES: glycoside hydrolase family 32 protein [unclassified Streptomyces]|uniref:glycoside hydrolase family 32 protein n=1 Tax=unclassified Streptomyces TaxID=2593676 RepID=UPI000A3F5441|nr:MULTISPECIES: glycoside hydrolase family 32 protein [unclassified Streptomyces]AZM59420.1 glycosyl hydrolase [Streptomyces sp. WAC 01438]RSM94073.1 glycosyl hydrolase [Streptomyces sp. WAC 01420]
MSPSPADPHLPGVHLRPPRNWINDPNGLVFHDGHYHVFFQYNPHGPQHANMHWGHYRSPDLINWEPLPVALAPTPGGYDADGCYSGNAVSDGDRMVAFYSAHRDDRWWQPITTAASADNGLTWTKRPDLLIPEPPAGTTMYRDPYVWRLDGRWRMLVGAALEDGRAAALLYESDDLEHWAYRGPFHTSGTTAGTGPTGWECPQYATFGDRSALVLSDWTPRGGPSHTTVVTGREENGRFTAMTGPVPLDRGPDFYAPALLKAPDDRWLMWGWAWEARDEAWTHEAGWAGVLTLPREVSLTPDGTVRQRPVRELLALRGPRVLHGTGQATRTEPAELGRVGHTFDLTAALVPDATGTSGLRLITSADGSEYLDIVLDPTAGRLVVDRTHASPDARARGGMYTAPCPAAARPGVPVALRVIVDRSMAEVFLADEQVLTLRFYPSTDEPWRLQARTTGQGRSDFAVEAWNLAPDGLPRETHLAGRGTQVALRAGRGCDG